MIIQAGNGCYLTQSRDVTYKDRRFEKSVSVASISEALMWKEIPESEKVQMEAENSIYEPEEVDYNYLKKVSTLRETISSRINESFFTVEQVLEMKAYFPLWTDLVGQEANIGFRFQYGELLYEVIKPHTFSEEWKPDSGTESLYKVVQNEASGSIDDPITWKYNMELFEGLYYIDKDILYLCIRNSGMGMAYENLADLVSGGFVELVMIVKQKSQLNHNLPNLTEVLKILIHTLKEKLVLKKINIILKWYNLFSYTEWWCACI